VDRRSGTNVRLEAEYFAVMDFLLKKYFLQIMRCNVPIAMKHREKIENTVLSEPLTNGLEE